MKSLTALLLLLSGSVLAYEENCSITTIELPSNFVVEPRAFITHSGTTHCNYKVSSSNEIGDDSNISVVVDFTLRLFDIDFNDVQSRTIALYHSSLKRSFYDNINKKDNLEFSEPFETTIFHKEFYCTKAALGIENRITIKSCITFDNGTLMEISYAHHSMGSIEEKVLQESLETFKYSIIRD